jgi:CHASE1-domain containing sensor protein
MANDDTQSMTFYRWAVGILVAVLLAGVPLLFSLAAMGTTTRLEHLTGRLEECFGETAANTKQIRINSERLAVIEWRLNHMRSLSGDPN